MVKTLGHVPELKLNIMTTKKQLPDNWWDYGINPIVGFKVPKVGDKKVHKRNVYEYRPEDDEKWWNENE